MAVIAETGRLLGVAIASQAVILFPDTVAIAGGISEAGDLLLGPVLGLINKTWGGTITLTATSQMRKE